MRINNSLEFVDFVKNNQLLSVLPDVGHLVVCVDEYRRLCSCATIESRIEKINSCKNLYINFIRRASEFKSVIFSKVDAQSITFAIDNQIVVTIIR